MGLDRRSRPAWCWVLFALLLPVLLFNHGYHPDPPRYGQRDDGVLDRPGDYYRGVPQAFARKGFLVVVPDYRGHGPSQGAAFTASSLASLWYTRDVIAAYFGASQLEGVDAERIYMLGHSMGGLITVRALAALGSRIVAASVWSVGVTDPVTARYMQDLGDADYDSSADSMGAQADALAAELQALKLSLADIDALATLHRVTTPLLIQHARNDQTTPVAASYAIAGRLRLMQRPFALKLYPSDEHLFSGDDLRAAVARSVDWFER